MAIPRNRGDVVNKLATPSKEDEKRNPLFYELWKERNKAHSLVASGNNVFASQKKQKHLS